MRVVPVTRLEDIEDKYGTECMLRDGSSQQCDFWNKRLWDEHVCPCSVAKTVNICLDLWFMEGVKKNMYRRIKSCLYKHNNRRFGSNPRIFKTDTSSKCDTTPSESIKFSLRSSSRNNDRNGTLKVL